ncbi:hypothetical protein CPAST_c08970 [Clostridium pasteurianum DSM 525 = ATCC 6013]|uniref:Uncharacterized protein n=1 Tax=Clostridium pasteurianum DSM 525 = ATCC 6013 TaxID=1262449 RepID=A0A0H3J2G7_CLOPA|nr:hypothetical protein [Clostridium pasteurianum]AJA46997.1 hypothetical protein CPAST_c08970 [Clostridium pasteurianum DSM 525 = ATCC 6013]AJA50985.1 hypothetical protein CLPA_c08970 [Clostridium pasteurianum DSM 525 = ATCC 6013]AOZ74374.1 hypothetical protein AQ983_04350 [Clostridium pasteurianum DSM 525 = ATCC 6013]AOZ78172.1 hypothetical protein AQ984_04355 [Clostridium pasteurianum]ELP58248.1 hypothetical protein F502_16140 [Clostridium pasteurianum DSM 525 = ATCC 6013]
MNKLDLILYIKTGNISSLLYLMALLIILIPITIVFVTDVPFSSTFSKISINTAFAFVMAGKILTLIKKKKTDKNIFVDIGILIGIFMAFIFNLTNLA